MSVVDGQASSFAPVGYALAAFALLLVVGLLVRLRVVRLSLTAWFGLAVGAYFLIRCMESPSLVDSWQEQGLILGAFVFYVTGVYYGRVSSNRGLAQILVLAVVGNILAWWLMNDTNANISVLGRPESTVIGPASRNVTLLVYKNFAGLMLCLCSALLTWYALWIKKTAGGILCLLLGIGGIVISFYCQTRVVFLVSPLLLAIGSILWVLQTVFSDKRLSGVQCFVLVLVVLGLAVFVADCCLNQSLLNAIWGVDSHLRFYIWSAAWRVVGDVPLWGAGASAAQWLMLPGYNAWNLPNYVHNEYLECWVNYGIIGVLLMFSLLFIHIFHGVRAMASEHSSAPVKMKICLALLCVVSIAVAALTDFVWHNFSIVGATAFACGVLAAPFPRPQLRLFDFRNWAPEVRNRVQPLRAESVPGKLLLMAGALMIALLSYSQSQTLIKSYANQWKFSELVADGASPEKQREFLLSVVPDYPDSRIADYYALLGPGDLDWKRYEQALRTILHHNPRQQHTAAMLADVLGRLRCFHEAELVFRRYYTGDGLDNTLINAWAVQYATNLYAWGQQMLSEGKREIAYSMFIHAENIMKKGKASFPSFRYRSGPKSWIDGGSKQRKNFISFCRTDLTVLRAVGTEPDDSWKAPLEPGGKPALYLRYQD